MRSGTVIAHDSRARPALAGKHEGRDPSDREARAERTGEWRPPGFCQQGLGGAIAGHHVCLGRLTRSVYPVLA